MRRDRISPRAAAELLQYSGAAVARVAAARMAAARAVLLQLLLCRDEQRCSQLQQRARFAASARERSHIFLVTSLTISKQVFEEFPHGTLKCEMIIARR